MEKIEAIQNYYKQSGSVAIVGLNDSMGSPILPWKKTLLQMIRETLATKDFSPVTIDAFSLLFNKTEHLEYFIENNLTIEEISLLNYYSSIASFEKVGTDFHLGLISKLIGLPIRLNKKNFMQDKPTLRLADVIRDTEHVVAVLGTGSNDEMRYVGNNPFAIKNDYKKRNQKPNYNYTYERALDPNTVPMIMDRVKRNIECVLSTKYQGSGDIQICMLSQFIPAGLQDETMKVFQELILKFNTLLLEVCNEYCIHYIDQMQISEKYATGKNNFHLPKKGIEMAANNIIDCIYQDILQGVKTKRDIEMQTKITNRGVKGVQISVQNDYQSVMEQRQDIVPASPMEIYAQERLDLIAKEHKLEEKVLQKVINSRRI